MSRACKNNRHMELFLRSVACHGPAEYGTSFEKSDIPNPLRPVVLDPAYQGGQQSAPQMRFLGRQWVQDGDCIGGVSGSQRERPCLQQTATVANQRFPNPM